MFNQKQNKLMAIVRAIPDSFRNCITTQKNVDPIDVNKAREQHKIYCDTLESLGLQLIMIEADEKFPDCCFTEDIAIVLDELAIITNPREKSRAGERKEMIKVLAPFRKLLHLEAPAYLDGGDVVHIGKKLFIGLSARTNQQAIDQIREFLQEYGYKVTGVPVQNTLHLKSACTYIGNNTVLLSKENVDPEYFADFHIIEVPRQESYSADALAINGKVLFPAGYPETAQMILDRGFELIPMDTSEIKKADGALTCMSVIFSVDD